MLISYKTEMEHSSYSKILLFLFKLCISIFILGRISCTDGSKYQANEVEALLTWKSNMEKDSQVILSSWVSDNHLCINWSGIICNEGGRVSSLNLSDYGIRGTLHDLNLTCFTEITSIDISCNFLFGMVSPKLGNLSRLTYLNLGFNHFSGNIPPQIGLLANLSVLNMHRNIMIGSIPHGIGKMRYLNRLDLGSNALTGSIPDSFAILNKLEIMDLSCNHLSENIPTQLGMLQSVVKLNLSHNNLSGYVPSSFQYCFSLTTIDISFNQLKGPLPNIPASLNVHSSFVSNNSGLCGDILGLEPCSSDTSIGGGTGGKSIAKIVLLACTIGMIVAAAVFIGSFLFVRKVWYQKEIGDFVPYYYTPSLVGCTYISQLTERFSSKYCIAVGRSSIVYKTEPGHRGLAVKQFNAAKDGWRSKSLLSVAQMLCKDLRHRNIVKCYGLCIEHESCRYIVFELLQTRNLSRILSEDEHAQNFGWSARIQVLQWVAEALFYMHHCSSTPVVHRNVESKNILFDNENVARLCGFGKALVINSGSPSDRFLTMDADAIFKIDVYSFGGLILEVLMGKPSVDFIAFVSSSTNSSSFIPLKDLIDHRALPPTYHEKEKIFCASWLAFSCLDPNPQLRPTMQKVCSNLAHVRPKKEFISSTVTISQLIDRNFFNPSQDGIDTFSIGQKAEAIAHVLASPNGR